MSNDNTQHTLVPRLRFLEFRDDGGWHPYTFRDVARRVKTSVPVADIALKDYVTTQNLLPDFCGVGRAANLPPVSTVTRFEPGDTLLANIRPYLKKAWFATRSGGASNDVFVFRSRGQVDPRFLTQRIQDDAFIAYVMSSAKGVKMPRGDLTHIEQFPFPLPQEGLEQEKIADCLGSLDDLIAAEGRKLMALRDHKKGLMQGLFPREGERQPRLRFPEFRNAPDWDVRKAGDFFSQRKEKGESGLSIYSVTINDGMVLRSTFDRNFHDIENPAGNKKAHRDDIAYNMMRMWQGACGVAPEDCMVSPAYVVLRPKKGAYSAFFDALFRRPATKHLLMAYSRGLTLDRLRLYFNDFVAIPLRVPAESEQRRVADCLSSLDAQITVQAEKLDALRTHKRGLMQQLFPAPEVS